MTEDSRLKDYNSSMIVGTHGGYIHYLQNEKKLMIHQKPLSEQKNLLLKAFFLNDEFYIYEFDDETLKFRQKFFQKLFGTALTCLAYFSISNYLFWKYIKKNSIINHNIKYLYLLGINIPPLIYFGFDGAKTFSVTNSFLYNKFLINRNNEFLNR